MYIDPGYDSLTRKDSTRAFMDGATPAHSGVVTFPSERLLSKYEADLTRLLATQCRVQALVDAWERERSFYLHALYVAVVTDWQAKMKAFVAGAMVRTRPRRRAALKARPWYRGQRHRTELRADYRLTSAFWWFLRPYGTAFSGDASTSAIPARHAHRVARFLIEYKNGNTYYSPFTALKDEIFGEILGLDAVGLKAARSAAPFLAYFDTTAVDVTKYPLPGAQAISVPLDQVLEYPATAARWLEVAKRESSAEVELHIPMDHMWVFPDLVEREKALTQWEAWFQNTSPRLMTSDTLARLAQEHEAVVTAAMADFTVQLAAQPR